MLVSLAVDGTRLVGHVLHPIIQEPGTSLFRRTNASESSRIVKQVEHHSAMVADEALLEEEWWRFCESRKRAYQHYFFGYGSWARLANRMTGFADLKYRAGRINTGNMLRCVSHREGLRTLYLQKATTGEEVQNGGFGHDLEERASRDLTLRAFSGGRPGPAEDLRNG